uniref:NADH dehydrogenase subunit 4 n=1 Tax=Euplotes vannus TaxID=5939 RepID=UPI002E7608D4|nr:NADH dehydrogenase subunit 4 [Euplotes vannus]UPM52103.1 NADH dehydrogenase subunit 4 [Euplotes vannus]
MLFFEYIGVLSLITVGFYFTFVNLVPGTVNFLLIRFLLGPVTVVFILLTYLYSALYFTYLDAYLTNAAGLLITVPGTGLYNLYAWPFVYIYLFISLITLLFCFAYNRNELATFQFYLTVIFITGGVLFYADSLILFFFSYEAFLLPSFLVLYNFAKTRKAVEAAFLMFFWTQLGAIFLIFNFQYIFFLSGVSTFNELTYVVYSPLEAQFLFWTVLVGFGVKFPIWPFYDWLPKAHVEASTNFSIFLSGVLVKFAFFGFIRYFLALGLDLLSWFVYPILLIGFLDASSKIYYQLDLKKLIAYSTVIEMHWLLFAVLNGSSFFWLAGFAMMISHALVSANFFLLIDSVTRRFKTRLISEVSGIFYVTPNLYFLILVMLIVFLGFPGSLLFVAEFLFFSALLEFSFGFFLLIFFVAYFAVPVCFFRSWFLLLFGLPATYLHAKKTSITDLATFELILISTIVVLLFWFGFSFQFFI